MRSASNMAAMVSSFGCSSLCSSIFTISGIVAAVLDLVGHLGDEGVEVHRGGLALAVTDGDVAGLGFLGTQNQHIGHAVHLLCGADLVADLLVVVVQSHADTGLHQLLGDGLSVVQRLFGDGQDLDLHRSQPSGELALGLLDQVGHEAVQRAEDRAVQDHGGLLGAVLVHIGQVELGGEAEVQLAGGEGVLGTNSGLHVDVQLRAVEGSLADFLGIFNAKAEDMGNFYRVPADNRGLNYDKFFKEGETERNTLTEFNSNNTYILNVEETKVKIAALDYIQKELSGEGNFVQ